VTRATPDCGCRTLIGPAPQPQCERAVSFENRIRVDCRVEQRLERRELERELTWAQPRHRPLHGCGKTELSTHAFERASLPEDGEGGARPVGGCEALNLVGFGEQDVTRVDWLIFAPHPHSTALFAFSRSEHQRRTEHVGQLRTLALTPVYGPEFDVGEAAKTVNSQRVGRSITAELETSDEALRPLELRPYPFLEVGASDQVNRSGNPRRSEGPIPRILLIGMDGGFAEQALKSDPHLEVRVVASLGSGCTQLPRMRPDVIVVAFQRTGSDDVAEVRRLLGAYRAPLLVISGPVDGQGVTAMIKAGAGGYLLTQDVFRLPDAIRELLRGGVPMSRSVSQLVLDRARRSSASMAAVREGGPSADDLITKRQREILKLLAQGHSYEDIGLALSLSINTVRSHVRTIYERLGASTKVEAVIAAMELHLLDRSTIR
jgi:DNA-binding NarL/FixJ family response regulator